MPFNINFLRHPCLGDVRGVGLVQGLEIVNNKEDRIPDDKLATEIMYGLKQKQVLVGITGRNKNVLLFTPPMCFTIENSRRFAKCLDEVLSANSTRMPLDMRPRSVIVTNKAGRKRPIIEKSEKQTMMECDELNDNKKMRISEADEDHYGDMD